MMATSTNPPHGFTNCDPDVEVATSDEFRLVNRNKLDNFVWGELRNGVLSFIVENRPQDGTGCRGRWMFAEMMQHFGANVQAVRGSWTYGDNLAKVNELTRGGAMPLEDAARHTWTGRRAAEWGFSQVEVVSAAGAPGRYRNVQIIFRA